MHNHHIRHVLSSLDSLLLLASPHLRCGLLLQELPLFPSRHILQHLLPLLFPFLLKFRFSIICPQVLFELLDLLGFVLTGRFYPAEGFGAVVRRGGEDIGEAEEEAEEGEGGIVGGGVVG